MFESSSESSDDDLEDLQKKLQQLENKKQVEAKMKTGGLNNSFDF